METTEIYRCGRCTSDVIRLIITTVKDVTTIKSKACPHCKKRYGIKKILTLKKLATQHED